MGTRENYAYGQSKYLKAEDLAGKTARVIIAAVEDVAFDERGLKPVLWFEGKKRGLVVNGTNFDILASISPRTQDWVGHTIVLKGEKVRFKGKFVNSVCVSVPKPQPKQQGAVVDDTDGGTDSAPH